MCTIVNRNNYHKISSSHYNITSSKCKNIYSNLRVIFPSSNTMNTQKCKNSNYKKDYPNCKILLWPIWPLDIYKKLWKIWSVPTLSVLSIALPKIHNSLADAFFFWTELLFSLSSWGSFLFFIYIFFWWFLCHHLNARPEQFNVCIKLTYPTITNLQLKYI